MKRYLVVIFVALLFSSIGELNSRLPEVERERIVATFVAAEDCNSHDELSLEILRNDILRSPSTNSNIISQRGTDGMQQQARQRNVSHSKSLPHTTPCRYAGRITEIFNFNQYKSSLRVGYYLYALCRLRI